MKVTFLKYIILLMISVLWGIMSYLTVAPLLFKRMNFGQYEFINLPGKDSIRMVYLYDNIFILFATIFLVSFLGNLVVNKIPKIGRPNKIIILTSGIACSLIYLCCDYTENYVYLCKGETVSSWISNLKYILAFIPLFISLIVEWIYTRRVSHFFNALLIFLLIDLAVFLLLLFSWPVMTALYLLMLLTFFGYMFMLRPKSTELS